MLSNLQKQLQDQLPGLDKTYPPVEEWNPEYCGEIPLSINDKGEWFYAGSPFTRPQLVNLFASVLKKEQDDYYLVTPVEKVKIAVADVPFIITQWHRDPHTRQIICTTATADTFYLDAQHTCELRLDPKQNQYLPYINIRRNLWAKLHQNVFYQWIDEAQESAGNVILYSGEYAVSLGQI